MGLEPASVCVSVRLFIHPNIDISETSKPFEIKFHLEHHWGGGKVA